MDVAGVVDVGLFVAVATVIARVRKLVKQLFEPDGVRPDTTTGSVRLKPDTTTASVRLKSRTPH
jgi:hypothetical protein